jgi:hypothetical protein
VKNQQCTLRSGPLFSPVPTPLMREAVVSFLWHFP